eukprot:Lithocolla_globosa_v1_NODE_3086_length_1769_cov_19.748541.p1 type:complete len:455 gc:universal NODE_3086_length_1769_cov_19.748541:1573-209(-)
MPGMDGKEKKGLTQSMEFLTATTTDLSVSNQSIDPNRLNDSGVPCLQNVTIVEREIKIYQKENAVVDDSHLLKVRIYRFWSEPESSKGAFYLSSFIMFLIVLSTATFCLESITTLSETKKQQQIWFGLETFVIMCFTLEYVVRLFTCPKLIPFIIAPFNIIDLVAIIPYYIELIFRAVGSSSGTNGLAVLRIIRLVRVLRLFKMGKNSSKLQLVADAMSRSREGIYMLVFLLVLAMTFFGSCIYFAETSICELNDADKVWYYIQDNSTACSFQNIFNGQWWSIVTMTTVGYGDMAVVSKLGKFIGWVAMLAGLLVIAFPITVIGSNLKDTYAENRKLMEETSVQKVMSEQKATNWLVKLGRAQKKHVDQDEPVPVKQVLKDYKQAREQLGETMKIIETKRRDVNRMVKRAYILMDELSNYHEKNEKNVRDSALSAPLLETSFSLDQSRGSESDR